MLPAFAWQLPFPDSNVAHYFIRNTKRTDTISTMCGLQIHPKSAVLAPKIRKCKLCIDKLGEDR
jgi:hypothetical protein